MLWQNLHSSAPLGLLALCARAVGLFITSRRDRTPLDLRLFLKSGDRTLTETWSYALPPEP